MRTAKSDHWLGGLWVVKDPKLLHADSEDWSDWTDTPTYLSLCCTHIIRTSKTDQADLSLRWAHMSFCWFCRAAAHLEWWRCVWWTRKSLEIKHICAAALSYQEIWGMPIIAFLQILCSICQNPRPKTFLLYSNVIGFACAKQVGTIWATSRENLIMPANNNTTDQSVLPGYRLLYDTCIWNTKTNYFLYLSRPVRVLPDQWPKPGTRESYIYRSVTCQCIRLPVHSNLAWVWERCSRVHSL